MVQKEVTLQLARDLDTRPVAMLVQVASRFKSDIRIEVENKRVNAKSIMGMMTLGLSSGEEVRIVAEGVDEKEALSEVEEFLTNK